MSFATLTKTEKRVLRDSIGAQCFGLLTSQALSGGVLLLYLHALKCGTSTILLVLAVGPFLSALLNIPLAYYAGRNGLKRSGQFGNVLMVAGMSVIILAPDLPGAALGWIVAGLLVNTIGSSLFLAGWFALLFNVVPKHYTGRFFGILRCCWQIVGIAFFGMVTLFFKAQTPIHVFQILLAICTAGLVIRMFFYQGIPESGGLKVDADFLPSLRAVIVHDGYSPFLAYVFLLVFFTSESMDVLRLMARQSLGFGDNSVLAMSVAGMTGSLGGFFLGGKIVDRWGTRPVFVICHLAFGLFLSLFPLRGFLPVQPVALAVAVSSLLGLAQATISIAFTARSFAVCAPEHRSLAVGLIFSFQTLASAVSGVFVSGALRSGVLQTTWQLHGLSLTIYDTILFFFALMVLLLIVTLGSGLDIIPRSPQPQTIPARIRDLSDEISIPET
ncbi:MAG TPA: MFS transporter [Verrucomicrobiae bacterium]